MKNDRKLDLKRDMLSSLDPDELGHVAGGSHYCVTQTITHTLTLPLNDCLDNIPTVDVCIPAIIELPGDTQ